ncbi:MAG TPA: TadE/TadG family type IV pilus assembly protein, partial [Polyangia bacterium]|nr:TadE/TadG family type IV pilus assembly protein [Polyangia bacterium]
MSFRLRRTKRQGQRGAAALEFALAMFVLLPIMIGICEYAYYFFIGINAVEAQRAGLLAAKNTTVSTSCTSGAVSTAQTAASTAVTAYFALNSLDTKVTIISSSSTPACHTTAPSPWWSMNLVVDYQPLFGFTMPWEKKSPTAGYLRYTVG